MKNNNNTTEVNNNTHISKLDAKIQRKIAYNLRMCGMYEEDINLVMTGKLRDLKDNIELSEVFAW